MSEELKLKPCHVCKSEPVVFKNYPKTLVHCKKPTCYLSKVVMTLEQWQSRPIEDALTATIAQKDAEIERLREGLISIRNLRKDSKGNTYVWFVNVMENIAQQALEEVK